MPNRSRNTIGEPPTFWKSLCFFIRWIEDKFCITDDVSNGNQTSHEENTAIENYGWKILNLKDIKNEWNYIIDKTDEYIFKEFQRQNSQNMEGVDKLSRTVVHFYHYPKDTEHDFLKGNRSLIERQFHLYWVYNPSKFEDFEFRMLEHMHDHELKHCNFLEMDDELTKIPINFSVIAPQNRNFPLVYIRLEELDFALKIEYTGKVVTMFDDLAQYCIQKKDNSKTC